MKLTINSSRKLEVSLLLILISNICFYTTETITIYKVMTLIGILLAATHFFQNCIYKLPVFNCVWWLFVVYFMYFIYGFFFLTAGSFEWDSLLVRLFENLSLYYDIISLLKCDKINVVKLFSLAGIFSALYLFIKEGRIILNGGRRIGDSLSGNVNTVGYNFGFISLLVTWYYSITKQKRCLFIITLFSIIMMLTGSKKAIVLLGLDLLLILYYERHKVGTWIILAGIVLLVGYVVFYIPYFYEILGYRIETMIMTLFSSSSSSSDMYSYSTDMRAMMIKEAFDLFLKKPLFGGGYNSFYANTITQYTYSHCNYTELLCNFGIFGTILYYSQPIGNLIYVLKKRKTRNIEHRNMLIICVFLLVEMLFADWATVVFSGQCLGYMPILFTSAIVGYIRRETKKG